MKKSYNWNLWGAAYLINGGCSDDGFDYFRGWLIAQGGTVFENALKKPDTLADVVTAEQTADEEFESTPVMGGRRLSMRHVQEDLYTEIYRPQQTGRSTERTNRRTLAGRRSCCHVPSPRGIGRKRL